MHDTLCSEETDLPAKQPCCQVCHLLQTACSKAVMSIRKLAPGSPHALTTIAGSLCLKEAVHKAAVQNNLHRVLMLTMLSSLLSSQQSGDTCCTNLVRLPEAVVYFVKLDCSPCMFVLLATHVPKAGIKDQTYMLCKVRPAAVLVRG